MVNVSGGIVERGFDALAGSIVNISGGSVGKDFDAFSGSEVNISGGSVGSNFEALSGSEVNISGGSVERLFRANFGSVVNISGGSVGDLFEAGSGSVVNISGGSVQNFDAFSGSEINLFGAEFLIDGVLLEELVLGEAFTITDRDIVLAGTLADGSAFTFDLSSSDDALWTVTLVEPLPALEGDYNADGFVNAADFVVWRDGSSPNSPANGYGVWASNFGSVAADAAAFELPSSVPEPSSSVALITACLGLLTRRRFLQLG